MIRLEGTFVTERIIFIGMFSSGKLEVKLNAKLRTIYAPAIYKFLEMIPITQPT